MILHLKNGRLHPEPRNVPTARKRVQLLAAECARIKSQLNDRERRHRTVVPGEDGRAAYLDWRNSAQHALRMHNMELRLLNEWLEKQGAGMLRKARDLLMTLVADDCDFNEEEKSFIQELDQFVNNAGNPVG